MGGQKIKKWNKNKNKNKNKSCLNELKKKLLDKHVCQVTIFRIFLSSQIKKVLFQKKYVAC